MAGIISPSMPVWVVENADRGNRAYCNLNEGLGKVLRFGANSPEVIERLRWLGSEFFTTMQVAVRGLADNSLKPLMAQALHMGDELHNRNAAASGLLFKRFTLALLASKLGSAAIERALTFLAGNDHFFLNISMAACKSMSDAAHGVPGSSLVTVMARNGVNFGIRLSGTGDRWFQAPANPVDGLYFPGYTVKDAAADLGDSAITETNGLGGFAMAASPAIVQFVGGTPADATANSRRMLSITLGSNPAFTLPALNFGGTPAGIDARLVTDSGVLPIINTGIAHRKAGVGQIGAGITTAPMECFNDVHRRACRRTRRRSRIVTEAQLEQDRGYRVRRQRTRHRRRTRLDPRAVQDRLPRGFASSRFDRAGLAARRLARQRTAGRLHPAPLGTVQSPRWTRCPWTTPWQTRRARSATCSSRRSPTNWPGAALPGRSSPSSRSPSSIPPTRLSRIRRNPSARSSTKPRRARGRGARVDDHGGCRTRLAAYRAVASSAAHSGERNHPPAARTRCAWSSRPVAAESRCPCKPDGTVVGVEAVVDKDLASGLLAHELSADLLVIPTGVARVAIRFGTPEQQWLDTMTVEEARAYLATGEFGAGSMEPKVAAVADFVACTPGAVGVIGLPEEMRAIIEGRSGTRVVSAAVTTGESQP